jgi:hypothetical protein
MDTKELNGEVAGTIKIAVDSNLTIFSPIE